MGVWVSQISNTSCEIISTNYRSNHYQLFANYNEKFGTVNLVSKTKKHICIFARMCGIAGIYGLTNKQTAFEKIQKMNQQQAHRGPDDDGVFVDDKIALGHRRLSIIDLSAAGKQPMQSTDGRYQIIFNGEMYNFMEVKSRLNDYPFKTKTDTEVVLASYLKWGKEFLHQFNGMYALAIWDNEKKELFIARDRLGIKPLYYYKKDDLFLFASEVRTLLASGLLPKKINKNALNDYFTYLTVHAPATIVKDIFMLMPGHQLTIDENSFEIKKYWGLQENMSHEAANQGKQEITKKVYTMLSESVERRLISDVPFGAFLSGGIDSSAVVGLMSKYQSQPVKTFTITFDESEFSEAKYAAQVAKLFGTDHHEFKLSSTDFLNELPDSLRALDHPSGDGHNSYMVSKITRNAGIKMALSGLGGDELFAGYPVFKRTHDLQNKAWIWSLPKPLRIAAGKVFTSIKPGVASEKFLQLLSLNDNKLENTFPIARQISSSAQSHNFLKTDNYIDAVNSILHNHLNSSITQLPLLSRVSIAEITTYMQNVLLRDTDQMSMNVALEVRVPFLDYKLVEYVLGIPDKFKYPTYPKKLLIESLNGLLPDEIVHRKKMGFLFPWSVWLKKELHVFCDEKINAFAQRSFIDKNNLLQRWKNYTNGNTDKQWLELWLCVVLECWMEENKIEE